MASERLVKIATIGIAFRLVFACLQTSPISFVARGKGPFPRATKEIRDVCTQANGFGAKKDRGKVFSVLTAREMKREAKNERGGRGRGRRTNP